MEIVILLVIILPVLITPFLLFWLVLSWRNRQFRKIAKELQLGYQCQYKWFTRGYVVGEYPVRSISGAYRGKEIRIIDIDTGEYNAPFPLARRLYKVIRRTQFFVNEQKDESTPKSFILTGRAPIRYIRKWLKRLG